MRTAFYQELPRCKVALLCREKRGCTCPGATWAGLCCDRCQTRSHRWPQSRPAPHWQGTIPQGPNWVSTAGDLKQGPSTASDMARKQATSRVQPETVPETSYLQHIPQLHPGNKARLKTSTLVTQSKQEVGVLGWAEIGLLSQWAEGVRRLQVRLVRAIGAHRDLMVAAECFFGDWQEHELQNVFFS